MKRSENFLLREVADTLVIVPVGEAAISFPGMVTLNGTGAYIWELVEENRTVAELTKALMDMYEVGQETAQKDVESFIQQLIPIGAISEN